MSFVGTTDFKQKEILVKDIKLDLENPRFNDRLIDRGLNKWTDKDLQDVIEEDGVQDILDSIREDGVRDPIWVVKKRKYDVIEGSRRLVVLRGLINSKQKPPKGVKYHKVDANVFPASISKKEIDVQRVILQTGKKPWGSFNYASAIFLLVRNDHYEEEEVATMMGKSVTFVKKELQNYKYYNELTKFQKKKKLPPDPRKYTYFQKVGPVVREKFFGTLPQRENFYQLITPDKNGITRIPSVSLKGGLVHFNKFAQNENILKKFMKNKLMTVDDAEEMWTGQSLKSSLPWIKKLRDVAKGLSQLDPDDIKKIKKDSNLLTLVKRVYAGTKQILDEK